MDHAGETIEEAAGAGADSARLDALERVALADPRNMVSVALDAARELLGMDVAYVTELTPDWQVATAVSRDTDRIPIEVGMGLPMAETFCRRMLSGETSHAVPDTRREPALEGLGVREVAAAYVGVPVQLSDGRVHGTLCCANREPKQALGDRDVNVMRVLARIVADQIEREHGGQVAIPEPARPPGMAARLDLWFAAAPHAAASARQALRSLTEHVDDDSLKTLELLVTELVGNSIRHASIGAESSVGLEVGVFADHVRAVVSDPGPGFEVTAPAPREDLAGGWGLVLVERMSRSWGVERNGGTRVWFEFELARAGSARS